MNWFRSKKHLLLSSLVCFTLEQGILEGSCAASNELSYDSALASPSGCSNVLSITAPISLALDNALLNTSVGTSGTPFNITGSGAVTISGSGGAGARNLLNVNITTNSANAYISVDPTITFQNGTVTVGSEVSNSTAHLIFLGTGSYGSGKISNYIIGQNGTLQFAVTGTVVGGVTLDDSTAAILVNSGQTVAVSGTVSGSGGLNLPGPGNLTLTAIESYTGGTTVGGGTLALSLAGDISASGGLSVNGTSTFDISGLSGSGTSVSDLVTASGSSIVLGSKSLAFGTNNSTTIAGAITGTNGSIVKRGVGIVSLTGTNTFTGGTTVNVGTLAVSLGGSLATSGSVTVNGLSTFDISLLTAPSLTIGDLATVSGSTVSLGANSLVFGTTNSTTIAGAVTGSGTLSKVGSGTVTISNANGLFTGPVALNAGQITIGSNTALGTNVLTMAAGTTLSVSAGVTAANNIVLSGAANIDVTSIGIGALSGIISGGGSLTKTGPYVLALSGINTYSGGTTVNAGTLALVNTGLLDNTGSVTLNGGTFDISDVDGAGVTIGSLASSLGSTVNLGTKILIFGGSGSPTLAGTIIGTGSITKQGTGVVTITGANSFSGGTTINAGTLALSGTGSLLPTAAVMVNGTATFDISNAIGGATIGDLTTISGTTVFLGSKTLTFGTALESVVAGAITGTGGSITKQGIGIATLSGASTFTGGTTINAGTLAIGSGGSLYSSGSVTVNGTAIFDISAFSSGLTIGDLTTQSETNIALGSNVLTFGTGNSTTIAGTIVGAGSLIKQGTGTVTISQDNTFEGVVNLSQGQITIAAAEALGTGTLTMGVGTTLSIGALIDAENAITLSGAATIDVSSGGPGTLSGIISGPSGALTKSGGDTLILSGANTYGGGTTINGGILELTQDGSLAATGTVTVNGIARFDISTITGTSSTIGALITALPSTVSLGGKTLIFGTGSSSNTTLAGTITGTGGSLQKVGTGTVTISNANTFTGGVGLNAGGILITNNTALGSGPLVMAAGTTLSVGALVNASNLITLSGAATIDASSGGPGTLSGIISGPSGSLTKTGPDILNLSGANIYANGTTIISGTLALTGTGSLLSTGFVTVNAGGFDISGLTNGGTTIGALTTLLGTQVTLGANSLTFGTAAPTTIAGTITGLDGSILKQGGGTVTLTASNTFTGGTTINAGTLALSGAGSLYPLGSVLLNVGTFDISGLSGSGTTIGDLTTLSGTTVGLGAKVLAFGTINNTTLAGNITGTGSLAKMGTGTVTISNGNAFSGGVALTAGEILITNNTALGTGALTMAGGTILSIGPGITASNFITLNGAATVDVSLGGIGTLSGVIGGTGSLAKTGSNILNLSAANTYNGGTIINGGTLALVNAGSLAAAGAVTLNVGTFDISGITPATSTTIGDLNTVSGTTVALGTNSLVFGTSTLNTAIAGAVIGTGTLVKNGTGSVTISNPNTLFTGGVALNVGTILITNNSALGTGILAMANSTILSIESGVSAANNIILGGAGTIDVSFGGPGTGTLSGNITGAGGSLIKTGVNTLALSGTNTYTNGTTIASGTLALVANGSLSPTGSVTVNGTGIFDISDLNISGTTIGDLTTGANSSVVLGNKSLTFGTGNSTIIAGLITGTGIGATLTKEGAGTVTMLNANTFNGGVFLTQGQITIGNNTALGGGLLTMSGGTTLSIESGISASNNIALNGAVNMDVSLGGTGTLSGNITGVSGSITKTGANILALSGTNNFARGTTINAGTLALVTTGSLSSSGAVTVNAGTFDISGINGPLTSIGELATLSGSTVALGNKSLLFGTNINTTIAGIISGSNGSIVKQGTGTATFSGASTFGGGATINAGTLALTGTGSFLATGAVTLNGSSVFDISGVTTTTGVTIGDLATSLGSNIVLGANRLNFGNGGVNNTAILGSITGTGSIAKLGSATVAISNSNNFSGGAFLNSGHLIINSNKALGTGTFTTSDSTGFTLADGVVLSNPINFHSGNTDIFVSGSNNEATMTGPAVGGGGFTKQGKGTLNWSGVGVYAGNTNVADGTLEVSPGGVVSSVVVSRGATYQSAGHSGSLLAYGEVIPGTSSAAADTVMTVNGQATFVGGSTLSMNIGNAGQTTIFVNGDVLIEDGSTVNFTLTPDYNKVNNVVTFLYSQGITGRFSPEHISVSSPLIQPVITQVGPGDLQVGLNLTDFSGMITDNNNAVAVGQAIYNLAANDNPIGTALISSMIGLGRLGDIEEALNEMHPALYKGLTLSQENNAVRVRDTLGYRFQQELNELHCSQYKSSKDEAEETAGNDLQRIQKQLKKKVKGCEKPQKQIINLWVDGFGDSLGQGAIRFAGSPQLGYQSNTGGVSVGADGNFAKYFYAGAMAAYTGSSTNWHDSQSKGTIDTGYAGLYFSAISDMFYGNLSVLGGWSHYSGDRSIVFPGVDTTATNSHNGSQLLSHADTGVNLGWKGLTFRPFDAFDLIAQSEDGFTESGAGIYNLHVDSSSAMMLRNELGMQFAGCLCFGSSRWTIAPKFSWVLETRTKGKGYKVEFEGTDLEFDITGYFPNRSLFSPGVMVTGLMLKDRLSVDLYYNGAFGERYSENNYGGQIRYGF